jgi:hypothetical protein
VFVPLKIFKSTYTLKLNKYISNLPTKSKALLLKERYSFFNNVFYKRDILRKFSKVTIFRLYRRSVSKLSDILQYKFFQLSTPRVLNINPAKFISPPKRDLVIRRVKFKPGYQTLWRNARKNLKELFLVKFSFQKNLTKFLTRFYRMSHSQVHTKSLIILEDVLLASKLLPDPLSVKFFTKKKTVYLNGNVINSTKVATFVGDFIQIALSN